jgi:hypothetical protein
MACPIAATVAGSPENVRYAQSAVTCAGSASGSHANRATAACGSDVASLSDLENLKKEACACKDKACADKVEKKANGMLSDEAIKKHGEKGMDLAFGVAMCIAQHQGK